MRWKLIDRRKDRKDNVIPVLIVVIFSEAVSMLSGSPDHLLASWCGGVTTLTEGIWIQVSFVGTTVGTGQELPRFLEGLGFGYFHPAAYHFLPEILRPPVTPV